MRQDNKNIHQLTIKTNTFNSSLMLGTGKYKNFQDTIDSISISGTSMVTVAIRRIHMRNKHDYNLLSTLKKKDIWILPNTAGCTNVEDAIRIASLGKEINKRIGQVENNFVKLEVIPDPTYLLPDPIGTLKAAEYLVKKDFTVLAYTNADPILAKQLEEVGCSAVMPLGSPIGSGQGIQNPFNLSIIINNANIPVIIDAGIGTASEAAYAMELGANGVLINTAIAQALSPQIMANSMKLAVKAGKHAYIAGRMRKQDKAMASSPTTTIST